MSFKVPAPFLSQQGKPSIELEDATLFGRVVNHISRQWPEHEVIGYRYAVNGPLWNNGSTADRQGLLDAVADRLFALATEDRMSVLGLGPVLLLPLGNAVPADKDLPMLTKVTPDTEFLIIPHDPAGGVRALYQRAHVVAPLTTGP